MSMSKASTCMPLSDKSSLQETDKKTLVSAAGKVQTHALIGSLVGVGLGAFLAIRLRSNRQKLFSAFKAAEKPTVRIWRARHESPGPGASQHMFSLTNAIACGLRKRQAGSHP
jgi:hypothetical protein